MLIDSGNPDREMLYCDLSRMSPEDRSGCAQDMVYFGLYVYEKIGDSVVRVDPLICNRFTPSNHPERT